MRLRFLAIFAAATAAVSPALAQEQNSEIIRVDPDMFLRWYGHDGRTYFAQVSDPNDHLRKWTWAPIIETGNNEDISYEVDGTADKGFFRLWFTDEPTTDPDGDDFDYDYLTNWEEVSIYQTNPLKDDTDDDGLWDDYEVLYYFSDPNDWDTDDDGISDGDEVWYYSSDPTSTDSDGDGLSDADEVFIHGTDPANFDSDGDGLSDTAEINTHGTNPLETDSDGDGMYDGFEITYSLNPLAAADATLDPDGDTLINFWEFRLGTDPTVADPDTDWDGLRDPAEVYLGLSITLQDTDGNGTTDANEDRDYDELLNLSEFSAHATDPRRYDTDLDTLNDGWEVANGFDPRVNNLSDANPLNDPGADPDIDGLTNSEEETIGAMANDPDSDGDGVDDKTERDQGSDPNDPNDDAPPPAGTTPVNVTFGDDSGSHSEKYRVLLTPLEGDATGHTERFRTNREYGESQTDTFHLPKGAKYRVELIHIDTNEDDGVPDYDHTLEIYTSQGCLVVDDPESIMGTSPQSGGTTFVIEGKSATLHVPLFEWVTPKASPVSAPNDTPGDGQNEFTYDAAAPGVLTIDLKVLVKPTGTAGVTGHDGVKFSDRCVFTLPTIAGSTFAWDAANPGGKSTASDENVIAKATYTTLPSLNSEFGLKEAEFKCDSETDVLPKAEFEVFFLKDETNHPSDATNATWPNWMFYWLQTVTPLGTPPPTFKYGASTFFTPGTTEITLSAGDAGVYNAPYSTNNPLEGIDNFAWTVIHESQHYKDWVDFWGNNYADWFNNKKGNAGPGDDKDGDRIPNSVEDVNSNGVYDAGDLYDWKNLNTPTPGRPAAIINDFEDWDCQRHTGATGNHSKDWANPGMQHQTIDKYND